MSSFYIIFPLILHNIRLRCLRTAIAANKLQIRNAGNKRNTAEMGYLGLFLPVHSCDKTAKKSNANLNMKKKVTLSLHWSVYGASPLGCMARSSHDRQFIYIDSVTSPHPSFSLAPRGVTYPAFWLTSTTKTLAIRLHALSFLTQSL